MAFFQDLQRSASRSPMMGGGSAAFGDAPVQQLFDAYSNRQPVRSLTTTGSGEYDYNMPDSATYGGFRIQAKPGQGGDANNPESFYIYRDLQPGQESEALNNTPFDVYTPDQKFQGSRTWQNVKGESGLDKLMDTAIPLLTTLFIGGGLAGAAGYGPMASGGAATPGAASGVTFGAEGVPTGFGTWDAGVAAMNSPGVTFASGGVPSGFGTWDAGVAASHAPGVTFGAGGTPVGFGSWEPSMAGGFEPTSVMMSGGMDVAPMAFDGGGFSGLSASDALGAFTAGPPANPFQGMSFFEQLANGAYSPGVIQNMMSNPAELLRKMKEMKLMKMVSPAMRLYAGMQGRKQAKALQGQMQGLMPQMQLPSAAEAAGSPGYQLGMDAVRRQMAAQGYLGSGNLMAALQEYGHRFYGDYVNQRLRSADSQLNAIRSQAGPAYANQSSMALLSQGLADLLGFF